MKKAFCLLLLNLILAMHFGPVAYAAGPDATLSFPVIAEYNRGNFSVIVQESEKLSLHMIVINTLEELKDAILNNDDHNIIEDGRDIMTIFSIIPLQYDVVKDIITATNRERADQEKIAFDISVTKETDTQNEDINESNQIITFKLNAPKNFDRTKADEASMICVHQDDENTYRVVFLPVTYNAEDDTISFQTRLFSAYVLSYNTATQETPKENENNPENPSDKNKPNNTSPTTDPANKDSEPDNKQSDPNNTSPKSTEPENKNNDNGTGNNGTDNSNGTNAGTNTNPGNNSNPSTNDNGNNGSNAGNNGNSTPIISPGTNGTGSTNTPTVTQTTGIASTTVPPVISNAAPGSTTTTTNTTSISSTGNNTSNTPSTNTSLASTNGTTTTDSTLNTTSSNASDDQNDKLGEEYIVKKNDDSRKSITADATPLPSLRILIIIIASIIIIYILTIDLIQKNSEKK